MFICYPFSILLLAMSLRGEHYSQGPLTFLDTDNYSVEYGGDTQGVEFDHYNFTIPSQTQSQTQASQLTQGTGQSTFRA